jgi:hypothetical protein
MKKQKLIAILALVPSIAFGSLIDLTPGGFHESDLPQVFLNFTRQVNRSVLFFDSIYASPTNGHPAGWVSQFGDLDGGIFFFSNIDLTGPIPTTTISWDFHNSGGFFLTYVLAEAAVPGNDFANLYKATNGFEGEGSITLDGIIDINSIAFYGQNFATIPDLGSTIGLFLIGLVTLYASSHYRFKPF